MHKLKKQCILHYTGILSEQLLHTVDSVQSNWHCSDNTQQHMTTNTAHIYNACLF